MPNGGVPLHMTIYPINNPNIVIHCSGSDLMVFDKETWDKYELTGAPIVKLTISEGKAIGWHIQYWLEYQHGEQLKPGFDISDIKVEY